VSSFCYNKGLNGFKTNSETKPENLSNTVHSVYCLLSTLNQFFLHGQVRPAQFRKESFSINKLLITSTGLHDAVEISSA
jgi:hypothetical protein